MPCNPPDPLPSVLNVKDFGALGDGCNDDTEAIQCALDQLYRYGDAPYGECGTGGDTWASWAVAVYFPAGVYRLTAPLKPPFAHSYRIYGDSGRGGGTYNDNGVPYGTVLRQDANGQPVFLFERDDSHSFVIERLAFTWKNPPPQEEDEIAPGAVGILFSYTPPNGTPPPGQMQAGYFNVRIRDCYFKRGFRGIAIDDRIATGGGPVLPITFWGSEIASCTFAEMKGAAVRLRNHPSLPAQGMPSNSFRDLFVFNNEEYRNVEEQIGLAAQGMCVLESLDLEGGVINTNQRGPLIYAEGGVSLSDIHLEHLDVHWPFYRVIYLSTVPATLDGLEVDGEFDAQGANNFGSIIHCEGPSLALSGAYGFRGDSQQGGGIYIPNQPGQGGDVMLITGGQNTQIHLLDQPHFPNRQSDTYKVHLWREDLFSGSPGGNVERVQPKTKADVTVPSLGPGATTTVSVAMPAAKVGDLVTLGPPGNLPVSLLFSGAVVVDDEVQLRFANASKTQTTQATTGAWMVAAGGGPRAGEPQVVQNASDALPPWPYPPIPTL